MISKSLFKNLLFVAIVSVFTFAKAQEKPNVIIIYTDDQGSADLNSYGAKDLETPNIDALVNDGVRFTQFYASPICSPSRASLIASAMGVAVIEMNDEEGANAAIDVIQKLSKAVGIPSGFRIGKIAYRSILSAKKTNLI